MKRPLKELLSITAMIYKDLAVRCHTDLCDVRRDLDYITLRTEYEGLSFLTITLPRFSADVMSALENNGIGREHFLGWKRFKCLPAFLRGFTRRIFNTHNGAILDEPCTESVKAVRQICLFAKKLKIPCTPNRESAAYKDYIKTEQELVYQDWSRPAAISYASVSRVLYSNIFSNFDIYSLLPNHGPGAVREGLRPNGKYTFSIWHDRLNRSFPYDWFANYNLNHTDDVRENLTNVDECGEEPIRIGSVPKTQLSPRIIGLEPACKMFTQQSIKSYMYDTIERHGITAGHVNFTDQSINQLLALTNSVDCEYATLDMKKASDLVLTDHVEVAYSGVPHLLNALMDSRSTDAELPTGEVIHLKKFASMGSATCFPVEAMHFFTICVASLLDKWKLQHNLENIKRVSKYVYVYGDDIIVPVHAVESVIDYMNQMGSIVNVSKSFYKGNFRESCGMDAYMGECVTPIYLRTLPPCDRTDASGFLSWVSMGNQLYKAGYYRGFSAVRSYIDRKHFFGKLPSIPCEEFPGVGWLKPYSNPASSYRYNSGFQTTQMRCPIVTPVRQKDKIEGWPALLKWYLESAKKGAPSFKDWMYPMERDKKNRHLEESVRRGAVSIKSRWVDTGMYLSN